MKSWGPCEATPASPALSSSNIAKRKRVAAIFTRSPPPLQNTLKYLHWLQEGLMAGPASHQAPAHIRSGFGYVLWVDLVPSLHRGPLVGEWVQGIG